MMQRHLTDANSIEQQNFFDSRIDDRIFFYLFDDIIDKCSLCRKAFDPDKKVIMMIKIIYNLESHPVEKFYAQIVFCDECREFYHEKISAAAEFEQDVLIRLFELNSKLADKKAASKYFIIQ
jgi:hypothetical protein